ncbi:CHRD domain-containing protein [Streptomyces chartreusis]|uniref:CHRD domain-containing protein n=1 Tax=Streptomyces chartreusis TaxID=1969 RepID=UPI0036A23C33
MRKYILALAAGLMAIGAASATPALADGGHNGHGSPGADVTQTNVNSKPQAPARGPATFFAASLTGAAEVPVANGPAVGDPDGKATALVTLKGDRVTFALQWQGIGAPTLGHFHQGKAGINGDVKVPLFTTAMPDTVNSAAGQVTVTDAVLAKQIRTNPRGFYVNLHSKEFPGGAVRGQLQKLNQRVNPLDIIQGGRLLALMDGGQEVPSGANSKVGDKDGHAVTFLRPQGTAVNYSLAWVNIAPPTLAHIHEGAFGKNGDVKIPLFTTPIPNNIFAVSGTAINQDAHVVQQVRQKPANFYSNIHTGEFPDGAVRGQLFDKRLGLGR